MKFKLIDAAGNAVQWVNDETLSKLPAGAVAMTEPEWEARQAAPRVRTAAELSASENEKILSKIAAIELNRQPRAMRDFAINGDSSRLLAIDADIAALRAKLVA